MVHSCLLLSVGHALLLQRGLFINNDNRIEAPFQINLKITIPKRQIWHLRQSSSEVMNADEM